MRKEAHEESEEMETKLMEHEEEIKQLKVCETCRLIRRSL